VTRALKGIGLPQRKQICWIGPRKTVPGKRFPTWSGQCRNRDYRIMAGVMKGFGKAH
jgi:hypothetical protein